jgi:uncharacterized protein (DUF1684 family)
VATVSQARADAQDAPSYEAEILVWRQTVEERLRSDNGWLTLTGLYWLHEGENSVGSDPSADVLLPASAPLRLGVIHFRDGKASFRPTGTEEAEALRDDEHPQGASRIEVGSVSFTVIKRGDQYGVRVRDKDNPARQTFAGRVWYPVDAQSRVTAKYVAHAEPRSLPVMNVVGIETPMENPGYVEFTLGGHTARLEAFAASSDEVWFVFQDTAGENYHGGRFLYAPVQDGSASLDFNKAYNPPCAFTPYATCPVPPKENHLPFAVEAGEKAPLNEKP